MSRTFTDDQNDALDSTHINLLMFAKLEFDSGTIYVHNGIGTYTWDSQNWLGVGDLGTISQVQEGLDVSPYSITLTLSGLPDAGFASTALTENYYKRPASVYVGLLDANDELIDTPIQVWSGFMDQMNMTVGADGGDAIQLIAESELARFDKSSDLMYTNASQQGRHSGDKFFNFIHKIQGQKLDWGKSGLGSGSPPDIDESNPKNPGVPF